MTVEVAFCGAHAETVTSPLNKVVVAVSMSRFMVTGRGIGLAVDVVESSVIMTFDVVVAELPDASVAVHVTVVVPCENIFGE